LSSCLDVLLPPCCIIQVVAYGEKSYKSNQIFQIICLICKDLNDFCPKGARLLVLMSSRLDVVPRRGTSAVDAYGIERARSAWRSW
jgi:hypothetical protein